MKKVLVILIGLSLILPMSIGARVASDCNDYCGHLDEAGIESPLGQVCVCNPIVTADFEVIIERVIDFIFKVAIFLAPLIAVFGGVLFATSGGDREKIIQAKNLIVWTAIGFVILLLAKGVMILIKELLGIE